MNKFPSGGRQGHQTGATMAGYLYTNGWAGRRQYRVELVKETPQRYRVRLLEPASLPGRMRQGQVGDVVTVPQHAVAWDNEQEAITQ